MGRSYFRAVSSQNGDKFVTSPPPPPIVERVIHLLSAVRALIFLARRVQPFLSLVDSEVKSCVVTI